MRAFILQVINALHDKGFSHKTIIVCAQLLQTVYGYYPGLKTSISSITRVHTLMYMHKLCMKHHSCELLDCFDREILNRENIC